MSSTENSYDLKPKLGVGQLVSDTFSILFKKMLKYLAAVFIINFGISYLSQIFILSDLAIGQPPMIDPSAYLSGKMIALQIGAVLIQTITWLVLILAAYDIKLGNSIRIGAYFKTAVICLFPVIVMYFLYSMAVTLGIALLIIPGLYLIAMWSVMAAAIVIERAGFGAMGRSNALTKDYRWPIMGFGVILILIAILVVGPVIVVQQLNLSNTGLTSLPSLPAILYQALSGAFIYLVFSISTALLYIRLIEIKEGIGGAEVAAVFD